MPAAAPAPQHGVRHEVRQDPLLGQPNGLPHDPLHDPLHGMLGSFALCLGILIAGGAAVFQATAGGTAFTTETLRRTAVAQAPVVVPDYRVVDVLGRAHNLRSLLAQGGRAVIVDFVYTRCTTLCLALGTVFQQLQAQIVAQGLQSRVGLLSISFDPLHDLPPALASYAQRMQMQPGIWQLVSLRSEADRRLLLDSFGIMVVPAPLGEFEHNAALHVVGPDGRLVRILGLGEGALALDLALDLTRSLAPSLTPSLASSMASSLTSSMASSMAAPPGAPQPRAVLP